MDKANLERSLKEATNGSAWITTSKLCKWLGCGKAKCNNFTSGMQKRINGNRFEYFIGDVIDRVMEDVE